MNINFLFKYNLSRIYQKCAYFIHLASLISPRKFHRQLSTSSPPLSHNYWKYIKFHRRRPVKDRNSEKLDSPRNILGYRSVQQHERLRFPRLHPAANSPQNPHMQTPKQLCCSPNPSSLYSPWPPYAGGFEGLNPGIAASLQSTGQFAGCLSTHQLQFLLPRILWATPLCERFPLFYTNNSATLLRNWQRNQFISPSTCTVFH